MKTVGAFEAKTHLSSLLDAVERGEEVLITKRGRLVAKLVPAAHRPKEETDAIIKRIKALRKGVTLGGLDWKALRDEGKK
ncbi:MAG: type II toxin-antitoxin system Phd/YefM family antitoxin [Alphaproteobacteria bacterium]|nr:type II toxin-antitoxin system Phd/YefM family antitoxin [Alphaproteobacteria bacterium]